MLVFQLLLRARGRNHLTPLSTALSTPGSRSNVVTSSKTQHFVLLRYNFVTSFNFLSTAQPKGDEMNRTQKSYARCLSYPIPHAQWFFNREETRDGGSVANIFPVFAHVGLLVGFTVHFFPLPERRDSKWTYIRTNEIWFTDRFRLHHVHRSECLRELGMGTVEDHYLAETHRVILNRLIFCSYA